MKFNIPSCLKCDKRVDNVEIEKFNYTCTVTVRVYCHGEETNITIPQEILFKYGDSIHLDDVFGPKQIEDRV